MFYPPEIWGYLLVTIKNNREIRIYRFLFLIGLLLTVNLGSYSSGAVQQYLNITIDPEQSRVGDTINVRITSDQYAYFAVSNFTVWIHDFADPSADWWSVMNETDYHQNISDEITIVDEGSGSYSFGYVIPNTPLFNHGHWLTLEVGFAGLSEWKLSLIHI